MDLRPTVVSKWIADLPLGSTGETTKQIYHALKQLNKQDSPLQQKLVFLETISPTLHLLYPRLSKYFSHVSLPLSKKTRNVIHVTQSLLNECLVAYLDIIKALLKQKPFGWKKPFAQALHRAFIYQSQLFCTYRLSYHPQAKGSWHTAYWLYQQAQNYGLLDKKFISFETSKSKTSILFQFKKLLLLSLIQANDLGQKNMQRVNALLSLWISYCDIKTRPGEKSSSFAFNLLGDEPPHLAEAMKDKTISTDTLFLLTHRLQAFLLQLLQKMGENDSITVKKNPLSRTTLQTLLKTWSRQQMRVQPRHPGKGFVDIITTISGIHFVLNQHEQPAYDECSDDAPDNNIDFASTLTIEPVTTSKSDTLNLAHFLGSTEEEKDVWEQVYTTSLNQEIPQAHWTESGVFKVYEFTRSILLDYSDDGYRLSVNANKVDSLKHNELVAVREHALAPWALCQVKWLHFSERGDVQFGLRVLSHNVLPVSIRYEANNILSKPLPCLLGLERKKLMLFVPTLPTQLNGRKLELEHHAQHSSIHLKNKLHSNPAFDVYEILESRSGNEEKANSKNIEAETTGETTDNIWSHF